MRIKKWIIGAPMVSVPLVFVSSCGTFNHQQTPSLFQVSQDGLYLLKKDYNGTLLQNSTLKAKTLVQGDKVQIQSPKSLYALDNSVQLGDGDSIYMLYTLKANDFLQPSNFTSTVFLNDTSIMATQAIEKINQKLGNDVTHNAMGSSSTYIKFVANANHQGGILNKYAGGQNNHVSPQNPFASAQDFQKAIKAFVQAYQGYPDLIKAVLQYYGLHTQPDAAGDYTKDPHLQGASEGFAPVFATKPIFTYQQVAKNAIKITFHSDQHYALTAGHFVIKTNDKFQNYGSFSVGDDKEWKAYYAHPEATYVGTKRFNQELWQN